MNDQRKATSPAQDLSPEAAMAAGARNLLVCCVGLRAGDRLLILREYSRHGYYDDAAALCVAAQAEVHWARRLPIGDAQGRVRQPGAERSDAR